MHQSAPRDLINGYFMKRIGRAAKFQGLLHGLIGEIGPAPAENCYEISERAADFAMHRLARFIDLRAIHAVSHCTSLRSTPVSYNFCNGAKNLWSLSRIMITASTSTSAASCIRFSSIRIVARTK